MVAVEERVQAQSSLGHHRALCADIEGLVGQHPLRERLWEQWMLTLYRSGRQADALRAYQRVRRLLGAFASSSVKAKLTPSIGFCGTPFSTAGAVMSHSS